MINRIQALLQDEKYHLQEFDKKIILFKGNLNVYPEDYIEIEKATAIDKFIVSEVHRDEKQFKIETEKEEASIYAVVMYKKLYDDIVDRMKARSIRNYVNSGEEEKALSCIKGWFNDSLYSIDTEDSLRISLIQSGDKVNVKFGGEYLAENASKARGYVVLYNYCEKLRNITLFCDEIHKKMNCNVNREKIIKMYIL